MKYINWSNPKNVKVVVKEVKNSPDNLKAAFKRAASALKSTEAAVNQAWYKFIRKESTAFNTKSSKVKYVNVKNSPRKAVSVKSPIHEVIVDTKTLDGMKVVTIKRYFTS